MKKHVLLSALLIAITACIGDPTTICNGACAEADLIIETTVKTLHGNSPSQPFLPGERFVVTTIVTSRSDTLLDTLYFNVPSPSPNQIYGEALHLIEGLAPGGSVQLTDTLQVPRYTFGTELELPLFVYDGQFRQTKLQRTGDTTVRTRSAGFAFDIVAIPNQPVGDTLRLWQYQESGALLHVSNPYELPLDSLQFSICLFDFDFCMAADTSEYVPQVAPGGETYFDVSFEFVASHWNWYQRITRPLGFCGSLDYLVRRCTWRYVTLLANIEALCDVQDIAAGQEVADADSECPKQGYDIRSASAWRFDATAGERYRVTGSGFETGFIVPGGGLPTDSQRSADYVAKQSGRHYVIVQHAQPVTVRLERVLE